MAPGQSMSETGGDSDPLPVNYLRPGNQTVVISNNNGTANFTALPATQLYHRQRKVQRHEHRRRWGSGPRHHQWHELLSICGHRRQRQLLAERGQRQLDASASNCSDGRSDSLDNIFGNGNYQCPNNQTVAINNNNGAANFTVQLCGGVTITTTSLPAGEVNVYYDQFGQASSCSSTFTWSIISGSLPPGLTANPSTGEIYGTPTTPALSISPSRSPTATA